MEDSDEGNEGSGNLSIYNISAGFDHVLALDEKNIVWGWGGNKENQIIHASQTKKDYYKKPVPIAVV